jgi:hypothetical protein
MTKSRRITLTLTDREKEMIRRFGDPDRPESAVLIDEARAMGIAIGPGASETTVLRALMAAGVAVLRDQVLERGYEQVASRYAEIHDAEERAARRLRHERSTRSNDA